MRTASALQLYRKGVESTIKISTNTRVQKEQLIQLSKSFKNSTVTFIGFQLLQADALTKISKTLVKVVNGSKYRYGTLKPGLEYIKLHKKFLEWNWYFKVKEGKAEYRDLVPERVVTCGLEDKIGKRVQDKKGIMNVLMEGKDSYDQTVSV